MSTAVVTPLSLAQFNAVPESDAHLLLGACLDIERWVLEVGARRPYPDWESLRARASANAGEQLLAALRERLTHDDKAERHVVMDELRKIAALRLAKAINR